MDLVSLSIDIADRTDVSAARREAVALAARSAPAVDRDALAIAATEGCQNIVKHAGRGQMLCNVHPDTPGALWLLFIDSGPGIPDLNRCLRDGHSTAGSCGTGLGAMVRQTSAAEFYAPAGQGTAVLLRLDPTVAPGRRRFDDVVVDAPPHRAVGSVGGWSIPHRDESVCGDGWLMRHEAGRSSLIVCDGLGHGPKAAEATQRALDTLDQTGPEAPEELLTNVHQAMRPTRGGAVAVATWELGRESLCYAGLGNLSAAVVHGDQIQHLVSRNGTAGYRTPRSSSVTAAWGPGAKLVVASDGLRLRLHETLDPLLWNRHPLLIAGLLYHRFTRGNDDATAVVVNSRAAD